MPAPAAIIPVTIDVSSIPAAFTNAIRRAQASAPTLTIKADSRPLGKISNDLREFDKSLAASNARVIAFGATTGVLYGLTSSFAGLIKTTIDVEKRLQSIQVILNASSQNFAKLKSSLFDIAGSTGQTFAAASEAAEEFSRQGLNLEQTLKRTKDALVLSRQSGLDFKESVQDLTAAVNTFRNEALDTTTVVNKLANVDANFAVSSRDLAESISRSGAVAKDAKISFDQLLAATTAVQQATARGGAVIGNAFKSIFTRVERPATLRALEELGVATKTLAGETIPVIDILENLGKKYQTLSESQRQSIAAQIAGTQQVNIAKALLGDLGRANSIYRSSLDVASKSTDEATKRNEELNQTLSAMINRAKESGAALASAFGGKTIEPALKGFLEGINGIFDKIKGLEGATSGIDKVGANLGKGIVDGIGSVIKGPGAVLLGAIFLSIFGKVAGYAKNSIIELSGLNKNSRQQEEVQANINRVLSQGNSYYKERLSAARTLQQQEEVILDLMRQENALLQLRQGASAANASALIGQGRNALGRGGFGGANEAGFNRVPNRVPRIAGGYIPSAADGLITSFLSEMTAIKNGVGGAGGSAKPVVVPSFAFGGGKRGTIVANTDEYMVKGYAGGSGSAIFNPKMVQAAGGLTKLSNFGQVQRIAAGGFVPNFRELSLNEIQKNLQIEFYRKKNVLKPDVAYNSNLALVGGVKGLSGPTIYSSTSVTTPLAPSIRGEGDISKRLKAITVRYNTPLIGLPLEHTEYQSLYQNLISQGFEAKAAQGKAFEIYARKTLGLEQAPDRTNLSTTLKHKGHYVNPNGLIDAISGEHTSPELLKRLGNISKFELKSGLFKDSPLPEGGHVLAVKTSTLKGGKGGYDSLDPSKRAPTIEEHAARKGYTLTNTDLSSAGVKSFISKIAYDLAEGKVPLGSGALRKVGLRVNRDFIDNIDKHGVDYLHKQINLDDVFSTAAKGFVPSFAAKPFESMFGSALLNIKGKTASIDGLSTYVQGQGHSKFVYEDIFSHLKEKGVKVVTGKLLPQFKTPSGKGAASTVKAMFPQIVRAGMTKKSILGVGNREFEFNGNTFNEELGVIAPEILKAAKGIGGLGDVSLRSYLASGFVPSFAGRHPIPLRIMKNIISDFKDNRGLQLTRGKESQFGGDSDLNVTLAKGAPMSELLHELGHFQKYQKNGALHPNVLQEEADANKEAMGILKEFGASKDVIAQYRKELLPAFKSYKREEIRKSIPVGLRKSQAAVMPHFHDTPNILGPKFTEAFRRDGVFFAKFLKSVGINSSTFKGNRGALDARFADGFVPSFNSPLGQFLNVFGHATTPENSGFAKIASRKTRGLAIRSVVGMNHPDLSDSILQGDLKRLLARTPPETLKKLIDAGAIRGVGPNHVDILSDNLASGHNPLLDAIGRESKHVGAQNVYIDSDSRLRSPRNPLGLLVANKRDEPHGGFQGVNRAIKEGADPQSYGAAQGHIPSFAAPTLDLSNVLNARTLGGLALRRAGGGENLADLPRRLQNVFENAVNQVFSSTDLNRIDTTRGQTHINQQLRELIANRVLPGVQLRNLQLSPQGQNIDRLLSTLTTRLSQLREGATPSLARQRSITEAIEASRAQQGPARDATTGARILNKAQSGALLNSVDDARFRAITRRELEKQIGIANPTQRREYIQGSPEQARNYENFVGRGVTSARSQLLSASALTRFQDQVGTHFFNQSQRGLLNPKRYIENSRFNDLINSAPNQALIRQNPELSRVIRDQRRQQSVQSVERLRGFGLTASFAAPLLAQSALNLAGKGPETRTGRIIGGGVEGLATGGVVASLAPGKLGGILGVAIAGFLSLKAVTTNLTRSFEDISKSITEQNNKRQEETNAIGAVIQSYDTLVDSSRTNLAARNRATNQFNAAITSLPASAQRQVREVFSTGENSDRGERLQTLLANSTSNSYRGAKLGLLQQEILQASDKTSLAPNGIIGGPNSRNLQKAFELRKEGGVKSVLAGLTFLSHNVANSKIFGGQGGEDINVFTGETPSGISPNQLISDRSAPLSKLTKSRLSDAAAAIPLADLSKTDLSKYKDRLAVGKNPSDAIKTIEDLYKEAAGAGADLEQITNVMETFSKIFKDEDKVNVAVQTLSKIEKSKKNIKLGEAMLKVTDSVNRFIDIEENVLRDISFNFALKDLRRKGARDNGLNRADALLDKASAGLTDTRTEQFRYGNAVQRSRSENVDSINDIVSKSLGNLNIPKEALSDPITRNAIAASVRNISEKPEIASTELRNIAKQVSSSRGEEQADKIEEAVKEGAKEIALKNEQFIQNRRKIDQEHEFNLSKINKDKAASFLGGDFTKLKDYDKTTINRGFGALRSGRADESRSRTISRAGSIVGLGDELQNLGLLDDAGRNKFGGIAKRGAILSQGKFIDDLIKKAQRSGQPDLVSILQSQKGSITEAAGEQAARRFKTGTGAEISQQQAFNKQLIENDSNRLQPLQQNTKAILDNISSLNKLSTQLDKIAAAEAAQEQSAKSDALEGTSLEPNKALGHVPNFTALSRELRDIRSGVGGALRSDRPVIANINGLGRTVVNSGESIVRDFLGTGKDAVFNRKMQKAFGGPMSALGRVENAAGGFVPNFVQANGVSFTSSLSKFFEGKGLRGQQLLDTVSQYAGKVAGLGNSANGQAFISPSVAGGNTRVAIAHEAFHAKNPFFGQSETLARFYGQFKGGAGSLLSRAASGIGEAANYNASLIFPDASTKSLYGSFFNRTHSIVNPIAASIKSGASTALSKVSSLLSGATSQRDLERAILTGSRNLGAAGGLLGKGLKVAGKVALPLQTALDTGIGGYEAYNSAQNLNTGKIGKSSTIGAGILGSTVDALASLDPTNLFLGGQKSEGIGNITDDSHFKFLGGSGIAKRLIKSLTGQDRFSNYLSGQVGNIAEMATYNNNATTSNPVKINIPEPPKAPYVPPARANYPIFGDEASLIPTSGNRSLKDISSEDLFLSKHTDIRSRSLQLGLDYVNPDLLLGGQFSKRITREQAAYNQLSEGHAARKGFRSAAQYERFLKTGELDSLGHTSDGLAGGFVPNFAFGAAYNRKTSRGRGFRNRIRGLGGIISRGGGGVSDNINRLVKGYGSAAFSNSIWDRVLGSDDDGSALDEAIEREAQAIKKHRGIPYNLARGMVFIGQHPSIGTGVGNYLDEPNGRTNPDMGILQGISRVMREGGNPRTAGAARGHIPNFAEKEDNDDLIKAIQALTDVLSDKTQTQTQTPNPGGVDVNHAISANVNVTVGGGVQNANDQLQQVINSALANLKAEIENKMNELQSNGRFTPLPPAAAPALGALIT